jgi:hypothetical protein
MLELPVTGGVAVGLGFGVGVAVGFGVGVAVADGVGVDVGVGVGVGVDCDPQGVTADVNCRGFGSESVKSFALLFVSVQPLLSRISAFVVVGAGAGLPSAEHEVGP